jgi:hypothetical protein
MLEERGYMPEERSYMKEKEKNECHGARLQRHTSSARTSLGPI